MYTVGFTTSIWRELRSFNTMEEAVEFHASNHDKWRGHFLVITPEREAVITPAHHLPAELAAQMDFEIEIFTLTNGERTGCRGCIPYRGANPIAKAMSA